MGQLKNRFTFGPYDERVVAETNRIYKICFYILSVGVLIDLYYGAMRMQVALVGGLVESVPVFDYISPVSVIALLAACIFAGISMTQKGFTETNRFAETDTFPWGYYTFCSVGAGMGVLVASTLLRSLAEVQLLGPSEIHWLWNFAIALIIAVPVVIGCYVLFYINFRAAKKVRSNRIDEDSVDEGEMSYNYLSTKE